jgi:uncharacterized protein (DUF1501 family)
MRLHAPSRRALLLASGTLFAWAHLPKFARAEGRDPRFLTIILRGALDGLATVAPVGDSDWLALRGDNALTLDGKLAALKLDEFFALNPAMPNLHRMFEAKEAIIVHASATPYRERSHFDGQDLLESGLPKPSASESGWLNRALSGLTPAGRVDPRGSKVFAVGPVTPLVVRGPASVLSWSPQRVLCRRAKTPCSGCLLSIAIATPNSPAFLKIIPSSQPVSSSAPVKSRPHRVLDKSVPTFPRRRVPLPSSWQNPMGRASARSRLTAGDTHFNEGIAQGRLSQLLGALDEALAAIKNSMGPAWRETVVALATEFGRTARINGTDGTDHGTATVALLVGGALKGGRVIADWPGLKPANLYQDRDLKPTIDLRAILKGVLRDHLRADEKTLAETVFPGSEAVKPMAGLVA